AENRLDCNQNGQFNPRNVFGSRRDSDHVYNTPRAWFMGRYLCPFSHSWEGPDAEFGPESDDIPWSLTPDRKVCVEDVKYLLSAHFQGTDYDPYLYRDTGKRGMYRSIGINRTGVATVCQIRSHVPDAIKGLEWVCFGPTTFDALLPVYTNVPKMPAYLANVTMDVSTENFYWASRLLATLADPHFAQSVQPLERYQDRVMTRGRQLVLEYDKKMTETGDFSQTAAANDALAKMAREETGKILNQLTLIASEQMKDGYDRADN
ncbi:MAG: C69 family dipeptidase, partial [Clostridia bacterium]|nr:C69 family dipeptidase [Clostridia bacterium]